MSELQKQQTVQTSNAHSSLQSKQAQVKEDGIVEEIELLGQKVSKAQMPDDLKIRLERMVDRLRRMAKFGSYSGEFELIDKYIDWIVRVPWGVMTPDRVDLVEAKKILDENHYGMDSVKSLILDYLAVMKLHMDQGSSAGTQPQTWANQGKSQSSDENAVKVQGDQQASASHDEMSRLQGSASHAPIICFVGLQGVGKTTMAKSIAQTLGRKFSRISLGAIGSVTQLRGQSRAYLDAEPGQIVKSLVRVNSMNPVILLDEIDKVSGKKGLLADVMASLLEILDPEQNSTFMDHYIDYPIDLSNVMFICTANNLGTLSTALLDRLEVIRFTSYSDEEKIKIAKDYLFPKVLKATALSYNQIQIEEDVWPQIVRPLGFDAGIRQLERNLTSLCRHVAREIVEKKTDKVVVTLENVKNYMPEGIGTLS